MHCGVALAKEGGIDKGTGCAWDEDLSLKQSKTKKSLVGEKRRELKRTHEEKREKINKHILISKGGARGRISSAEHENASPQQIRGFGRAGGPVKGVLTFAID